jgi:hypothetical protein
MALVDASCLLTRGFFGDLSVSLSLNLIRGADNLKNLSFFCQILVQFSTWATWLAENAQ